MARIAECFSSSMARRTLRPMKSSKIFVLLGGIIGIVAFFLPVITVKNDDVTA